MNREERDQQLFDNIAQNFDKKDTFNSTSIIRKKRLIRAVKPIIDNNNNLGNVIDVGCGVGSAAKYLKGKYKSYLGIDHSDGLIMAARKFNKDNENATFICSNIKAQELPKIKSDTILALGVLHHMTKLDIVLSSLKKMAKHGSYIVAIEPIDVNPFVQLLRWIRGKIDSSYSDEQHFFSVDQLINLFASNGLSNISVKYTGIFAKPLSTVVLHPQFIFIPISRLFIKLDNLIEKYFPWLMKKMAWDVVITARFPH